MPNPDKSSFIAAYFDAFEHKINRLSAMRDSYPEEAFTLCLVYIDRLASGRFYSGNVYENGKNFWRVLTELTSISVFGMLHPRQLIEEAKAHVPSAVPVLEGLIAGCPTELLTELQVSGALLASNIRVEDRKRVLPFLWKASVANIAYEFIRNPAVHGPGAGSLSFSQTTYDGKKGFALDFETFYAALREISGHIKEISVTTGEWFGNPAI